METTRQEHLKWCKQRALEYVDMGNLGQAWASMCSDLGEHPETAGHVAIKLGTVMMSNNHLSTPHKMRDFICGFN